MPRPSCRRLVAAIAFRCRSLSTPGSWAQMGHTSHDEEALVVRPLTVWNAYLAAQEAILRHINWMENTRPALIEVRAAQSYFDRRVRLRDRCALRISAALRELSKV